MVATSKHNNAGSVWRLSIWFLQGRISRPLSKPKEGSMRRECSVSTRYSPSALKISQYLSLSLSLWWWSTDTFLKVVALSSLSLPFIGGTADVAQQEKVLTDVLTPFRSIRPYWTSPVHFSMSLFNRLLSLGSALPSLSSRVQNTFTKSVWSRIYMSRKGKWRNHCKFLWNSR